MWVAKCHSGEVKHKTILASGLHRMWVVLGNFTALLLVNHFAHVAFLCSSFSCFCPQLSLPCRCVLVSICAFLHRGFLCDGAWWLPLTRLSWLPCALACSFLQFHQAPSLHPSVVDGFNKMLPPRSA